MASIVIPSVDWAQKYKLKQIRFAHLRKDFIKTKVAELANKIIVDEIIEEMRREGVSRKIYETVELLEPVITSENIFLRVYSEYFSDDGFDVALAREEGTDNDKSDHKHWVRPREKKALKWIQGGKARFSGGHKVTGLPKLNIIQKTIERKQVELQEKLNNAYQEWKNEVILVK